MSLVKSNSLWSDGFRRFRKDSRTPLNLGINVYGATDIGSRRRLQVSEVVLPKLDLPNNGLGA